MEDSTEPSTIATRGARGIALWANLSVIYLVWGSTYLGIAIAIETIPAFLMAAIRFTIAGLIIIAFDLVRRPASRRMPTRRQLMDSIIVGALLLGIGNGFVVFGQSLDVPSGIAAIFVAMTPLWFALFGWLYLRERLPLLTMGAIGIGFAGTLLLIWPGGGGANTFNLFGILMLILAELGWAHGSIYSQRAQLPRSPLIASGLQMLAGGAVTFAEALISGEPAQLHPGAVSAASLLALAYLIFFGSMLAYTSYEWLLQKAPLSLVGTYAYVNPMVAVALGTIFLAEPLSLRTISASGIILFAVAIIVTARGRASRNAPGGSPAGSRNGDGSATSGLGSQAASAFRRTPAPQQHDAGGDDPDQERQVRDVP